jgi:hypothetical protein
MRYRLRTLLIASAFTPPTLAGCYAAWTDLLLFAQVIGAAVLVSVFSAVVWLSVF